jgi:predicted Zn-dependent peptidase
MISMLVGADLGVQYLRDFPAQLQAVTVDDVLAAAATWMAPARLTAVLVGDLAVISDPLKTLIAVETQ